MSSNLIFAAAAPGVESSALTDTNLIQKRALFTSARDALGRHQTQAYRKLAAQLEDYPLYPCLLYWDLVKRLDKASNNEIRDFLGKYSDSDAGARLRYD